MVLLRSWPLLVALTLSGGSARGQAPDAARWLRNQIAKHASDPAIAGAKVGVAVLGARSGRVLVQQRVDELFNVASNAKLVTAAAALAHLGPEYRFKTALYIHRTPARARRRRRRRRAPVPSTVEGDLYLKGFGSPLLSEKDLWQMARDLRDRGVRRIKGRLVIDESYFDGQRLAPLYDSKDTDAWYRPANGALSLSSNVVAVRVRGGKTAGLPAVVLLRPRSSYLKLVNKTLTVSPRRRSWIKVKTRKTARHTEVIVRGRVRTGYRGRAHRRRVADPGLVTGYALLQQLARKGIKVDHPTVGRGKVPPMSRALVVNYSEPLAVVVREMNKHSNNFIAEQVLKVLGAEVYGPPARWSNGLRAVREHLQKLGLRSGAYTYKNGSGLYDATRFSPRQIATILRKTYLTFKTGADFTASLSIAGTDGTLQHRLIGSGAERYVRAKTGTLARVVALSGFAGATKRRGPLAFSILINDLPKRRVLQARAVADRIVADIVSYLER
jgi:D-alanyl-D-alanine carboxypeptidase/D-alanyl-D-alanine-endopeptidase (penicillin-binding protein 4)